MKKLITLLTLFTCFSLSSCSSRDAEGNSKVKLLLKPPVSYCFVYCDFTNSMNPIAHAKVIRDALTIYDSLSSTHHLSFSTIGNNAFRESMISPWFEMKGLMTEPERNQKLLAKVKFRDSLGKYLEKAEREETSTRTCILSNMKQAIQNCLNINESGEGNFKLIFLSDMLENCNGINIQSGKYKDADTKLSKMEITDSFSKFKNLTIAVVISYSKDNADDQLTAFWGKVFAKFNYTGPHVRPSPDIPWEKLH